MTKTFSPTLPRDKWINAKIRVTKNGKIEARVPRSVVKNPAGTPYNRPYIVFPPGGLPGDGVSFKSLAKAKTFAEKMRINGWGNAIVKHFVGGSDHGTVVYKASGRVNR